jgi:hypothetical protein
MHSSASIDSRFRNGNEVGLMMFSLSDSSGASNGMPPASRIPVLTSSASARRFRLHGLMSDQVLSIPTTGRPIRSSRLHPEAARVERCTNPGKSSLRNQRALRSGRRCIASSSPMRLPRRESQQSYARPAMLICHLGCGFQQECEALAVQLADSCRIPRICLHGARQTGRHSGPRAPRNATNDGRDSR